jgi:uncharacterized protein
MVDILYTVDKQCPNCGKSFTVTRVRNRLTMLQRDSDFCMHYKDINPYYYSIWVCTHCGYAASENTFTELSPLAGEKIKKFLEGRQVNADFSGIRTREQAIATYKLAIYYAGLMDAPKSRLAGLYLKLAWLFREAEQANEEQALLKLAAEHYQEALSQEPLPIGNMTELTVAYLIGELHRRTNNLSKALVYLGKVVSDPRAKSEKQILDLARDAWQEARNAKKEGGGQA